MPFLVWQSAAGDRARGRAVDLGDVDRRMLQAMLVGLGRECRIDEPFVGVKMPEGCKGFPQDAQHGGLVFNGRLADDAAVHGSRAVASISTLARSSINALTTTTDMAGK